MISNKKVINNKVVELIKIYYFCFGYFFIRQSVSKTLFTNDISLLNYIRV